MRKLIGRGNDLCACCVNVAELLLFRCCCRKPLGEGLRKGVCIARQQAAVLPIKNVFLILSLHTGNIIVEGTDAEVFGRQDQFASRVVCAVIVLCILHDDHIIAERLYGLVGDGDDNRTVEAHDAPALSLADGDRVGGVGCNLIVFRRDDEGTRGVDCAPLLALPHNGKRCGGVGPGDLRLCDGQRDSLSRISQKQEDSG